MGGWGVFRAIMLRGGNWGCVMGDGRCGLGELRSGE